MNHQFFIFNLLFIWNFTFKSLPFTITHSKSLKSQNPKFKSLTISAQNLNLWQAYLGTTFAFSGDKRFVRAPTPRFFRGRLLYPIWNSFKQSVVTEMVSFLWKDCTRPIFVVLLHFGLCSFLWSNFSGTTLNTLYQRYTNKVDVRIKWATANVWELQGVSFFQLKWTTQCKR